MISPESPQYPNITTLKLTAYLLSEIPVLPPDDMHEGTFALLSPPGRAMNHLAKDKFRVYRLVCAGMGCKYTPIAGADPTTFEEVVVRRDANLGSTAILTRDHKCLYVCSLRRCRALDQIN